MGALFTIKKSTNASLKKKKKKTKENADFSKIWTWDVESKWVLSICLDWADASCVFAFFFFFFFLLAPLAHEQSTKTNE